MIKFSKEDIEMNDWKIGDKVKIKKRGWIGTFYYQPSGLGWEKQKGIASSTGVEVFHQDELINLSLQARQQVRDEKGRFAKNELNFMKPYKYSPEYSKMLELESRMSNIEKRTDQHYDVIRIDVIEGKIGALEYQLGSIEKQLVEMEKLINKML